MQEILDDHESKYGSAIGDQLGVVQEQKEEVKVGSGLWAKMFVVIFTYSLRNFYIKYPKSSCSFRYLTLDLGCSKSKKGDIEYANPIIVEKDMWRLSKILVLTIFATTFECVS